MWLGLKFVLVILTSLIGAVEVEKLIIPARLDEYLLLNDSAMGSSVVLMVHVNWCGACKRTLPELRKAASKFSISDSVVFYELDVTDDSDFSQTLGVNAFPALRVLPRYSHPSTAYADWASIPFYMREAGSIANFVNRVNSGNWIELQSLKSLKESIRSPIYGYLQSLIFTGDVLPGDTQLKLKFQIISVSRKIFDAFSNHSCKSNHVCAVIAPIPSLVLDVEGTSMKLPMFEESDGSLETWAERHRFAGVWRVDEEMFQVFNDQSVFKVLIATDPKLVSDQGVVNEIKKCRNELIGKVSFAIIDGRAFSTALADFGIQFESVATIMFTQKPLDFTRYFSDIHIESLCADIHDAMSGQMEMKYRSSWIMKMYLKSVSVLGESGIFCVVLTLIAATALLIAVILSACFADKKKLKSA